MFVKFNEETGEITGIGPKLDPDSNSIEVELEKVLPIIEGKESRRNYRVQYDPKNRELAFVNVTEQTFNSSDVNDFIYEIPDYDINDADITVEQNIPETCWKIKLGQQLKNSLKQKKLKLNTTLAFSVTAKHDPNVLYRTLFVDFSKVAFDNYVILDFTMPFETQYLPVSVFTMRKFDSYQFVRVT